MSLVVYENLEEVELLTRNDRNRGEFNPYRSTTQQLIGFDPITQGNRNLQNFVRERNYWFGEIHTYFNRLYTRLGRSNRICLLITLLICGIILIPSLIMRRATPSGIRERENTCSDSPFMNEEPDTRSHCFV